jgi:pimeloyl-ACP methyl ester carboxylesterase
MVPLRARLSCQLLMTTLSQTLPTAHWTQLEKPTEVNSIIRNWLTGLDAKQEHPRDEL